MEDIMAKNKASKKSRNVATTSRLDSF